MRIETIATGDELLTGIISDTNSAFFQGLLLQQTGLTVKRGVVVGDDRDDIIEALNAAAARCDFVLVSGGLGPTTDDFTAECAAKAVGVELVENAQAMEHIRVRFEKRGLKLTDNNRRQAHVPDGAEVVLNLEGAAPMFVQRRGSCTLFFVPGVPREYRHLVETHVVPRIAKHAGTSEVRKLAVLKTSIPESHLDAKVRPIMPLHPKVTFGFRTHAPENHLKLLAVGATEAETSATLEAAVTAAREVLGAQMFGRDEETLASVVLSLLRSSKQFLAVAESCTGGLVSALLTAVPGSSDVFFGGAVTYRDEAKVKWAHVAEGLIGQFGAVSREAAETMASGVRSETGCTWGLSVTGYAGPTGEDVGSVFIGLSGPGVVKVEHHRFHGDRERVRSFAAHTALDLLRRTLQGVAS